jgi:hypothetical protein
MLYDPKWEVKSETKPSLLGFIAWLEVQPPDDTYDYAMPHECALAQYYATLGRVCGFHAEEVFTNQFQQMHALARPSTFGAALKRVRALAGK